MLDAAEFGKFHQALEEPMQGSSAMAQGRFHAQPQFGESSMVFGDLKERVVPETAAAAAFLEDTSPAAAFAL